jgi:hypothetical protein
MWSNTFQYQVQMSPRHGESVEVSTALSMGSRCCLDRCPCLPHGSTDLHRSPLDQSFGMTLNKEQHRTSCACQVTKWKGKRSSCLAQRLPHPSTYNNHHVSFKHGGQTVWIELVRTPWHFGHFLSIMMAKDGKSIDPHADHKYLTPVLYAANWGKLRDRNCQLPPITFSVLCCLFV